MLNIVSWNINGIRTLPNQLKCTLDSLNGDIICFQETKVDRGQLDSTIGSIPGYNAYFSSSKKRSGYSGVSIYCKEPIRPVKAEEGLACFSNEEDGIGIPLESPIFSEFSDQELRELESEGRSVCLQFETQCCDGQRHSLIVINVYCPRRDVDKPDRIQYKEKFHKLLQMRSQELIKTGHHVIIAGDFNISHRPIDHCDPENDTLSKLVGTDKDSKSHKETYSGALHIDFLATPSRQWMNSILVPFQRDPPEDDIFEDKLRLEFVDSFRFLNPLKEGAYTCWCSKTGARQTNYGNRIDYILCDSNLKPFISAASIHQEIEGSDHCPIRTIFTILVIPSKKAPSLCTSYLPQCQGRQLTIKDFFNKSSAQAKPSIDSIGVKRTKPPLQSKLGFSKVIKLEKSSSEIARPIIHNSNNSSTQSNSQQSDSSVVSAWRALLKGPEKAPYCTGHNKKCLLRTVKKEDSANKGRQFWICPNPEGHPSNPDSRCNFFRWLS